MPPPATAACGLSCAVLWEAAFVQEIESETAKIPDLLANVLGLFSLLSFWLM